MMLVGAGKGRYRAEFDEFHGDDGQSDGRGGLGRHGVGQKRTQKLAYSQVHALLPG